MKRFVEGEDRTQSTLFPERLEDYISEENPVRVIEAFIDELDLKVLGFEGIEPRTTGRPWFDVEEDKAADPRRFSLPRYGEGSAGRQNACDPESGVVLERLVASIVL